MDIMKEIKKLCTPAYFYLVISVIGMIIISIQNLGNTDKYCIGDYKCHNVNTLYMFMGKILYIAFWTFILNSFCKAGYKNISWFLVLIPYMLFFIFIGMFIIAKAK